MGPLTGHTGLNRHLTVMKIWNDPTCLECGVEEETVNHFSGRRNARKLVRYSILAAYLKQSEDLCHIKQNTLEVCENLLEVSQTFGLTGDARSALTLSSW